MTTNEMTIAEASAKFGIKHRTLWQAVKEKRVKARRSGRTWLIDKHDMTIAIILRRVKVDKALVDAMVEEYLVSPTADPGLTAGDSGNETGTDMGGGE